MAETVSMPKLGFDMQEGTLVRWVRGEGENISKGDILAEIETDKATVEVESSATGVVRKLLADPGAVVPIGSPIAIIGTKDEPIETPAAPAAVSEKPTVHAAMAVSEAAPTELVAAPAAPEGASGKASPLARKMAREANVDLLNIQGSGPGGRIVRKDVEAAMAGSPKAGTTPKPGPFRQAETASREDVKVPFSKLRQAIARRMSASKTTVPHFYVTHEYKVDSLLEMREQANAIIGPDEKLSVNDFVVKAAALCLREFPNLNAAFQVDHVLQRGAINIGIAVAVDGGLLTVVCQNADQKTLREISAELKAITARARAGKVHPADVDGSTFTVSNLGMYDVDSFAAIINPPEAAILAVGSAMQAAAVVDGQIRASWRMKATIAVDHRVSDGAEAARFLQALAGYLERPVSLML